MSKKTKTESSIIDVPFNKLARAPENVRVQKASPEKIEAIAASILAQNLLQNLVGYVQGDTYNVVAGGNRLEAIGQLVARGEKPADWPVAFKVIPKEEATSASLAENTQRQNMHPADEFDAFRKLNENEGWTIDRIADAFGVTPLVVERRLRLIAAAPELIEEFRADELTTDQLIALCSSDDHERQVTVWNNAKGRHWMEEPKELRKAVLGEGEVEVSRDKRVGFIGGLDAYRAAGGEVRRDLLTGDGNGGFITDVALLDKLVYDKLEETAEQLQSEGWGWVDLWMDFDYTEFHRMGRAPKVTKELADLPEAVRAKVDALQAEDEKLCKELAAIAEKDADDCSEEEEQRYGEIEDRRIEIEEALDGVAEAFAEYLPEVLAKSGVIISFDRGELRIERGMVKTADRKAVAAAAGNDDAVKGGRETESAGRKTDAVSDSLRRSLLGHRNLAAQIVTAERPDVAKVLLACWTVEHIRGRGMHRYGGSEVPSDFSIAQGSGCRVYHPILDEAGKDKAEAFSEKCAALVAKLPTADGKLWDALAAMKSAELDAIIAYGVGLSVSLDNEHKGYTAKLLAALDFDMADHFTATPENYLGKVPKPLIVEALKDAGKAKGEDDKTALLAMKKGELAAEAETRLAGTGWVPKVIRTPKPKNPAPKKAPAKKAAKAKKALAKKA